MTLYVDIDGTICTLAEDGDYAKAEPFEGRIAALNRCFDRGNEIVYYTSRGKRSGKDWSALTRAQLDKWGVKRTALSFDKPAWDLMLDDKAWAAPLSDALFEIELRVAERAHE